MSERKHGAVVSVDIDALLQDTWLQVISLRYGPQFQEGEGRILWERCIADVERVQRELKASELDETSCQHILSAQCALLDETVKGRGVEDDACVQWYDIPLPTLAAMERCRQRGGRIIAVGTTTVRTLESWAKYGNISGDTSIFITPGFQYQVVDLLITNFHLPKSTLMMLVSAFAGYAHIMGLYRHAIAQRYRFFSYGDAMLLERHQAR